MKNIGGNLERLKLKNRQLILRLLNDKGSMSRKFIAQAISLTSASISQLCSEMIAEGLIIEIGESINTTKAGRKEILININYENRYAICINVEKFSTTITLLDLIGNVIFFKKVKTEIYIESYIFLKKLAQICQTFLQDNTFISGKIIGVGVTLRGLVNKERGISLHSYEIWDREVAVKEILESLLPFPVIVENNLRAFAQAEMIYGIGKNYCNLVFLKWFPGVGSSLVIDQSVYEGSNGLAGELAHYLVEENGIRCTCGKRGCLETLISFEAIVNNINLIYSKSMTPILYTSTNGEKSNISMFLRNCLKNNITNLDEYVFEILDKAIQTLALHTFNAVTFMAPQKLIVYGDFFAYDYIYNKFIESYKSYSTDWNEDLIFRSKLSNKISYIGALAIVVEQFFFKVGGTIIN
ncbi:MAG: hypothetical protein ATN31_05605 [Candidatus Epulonipiscioides saccharophilum]|nr:MAG: hypothetical protein ATN31_05605 [Epulopiscium sp. AS2M-Bin001]